MIHSRTNIVFTEDWSPRPLLPNTTSPPERLGSKATRRKSRTKSKRTRPFSAKTTVTVPGVPEDLSFCEQRLGTLSMLSLLENARYHKILVESATSSVDNKPPATEAQALVRKRNRETDPMPELDLPKSAKLGASFSMLSQLKWQMEWHHVLISKARSHTDQELPKHVVAYREKQRQLNRSLMNGIKKQGTPGKRRLHQRPV